MRLVSTRHWMFASALMTTMKFRQECIVTKETIDMCTIYYALMVNGIYGQRRAFVLVHVRVAVHSGIGDTVALYVKLHVGFDRYA